MTDGYGRWLSVDGDGDGYGRRLRPSTIAMSHQPSAISHGSSATKGTERREVLTRLLFDVLVQAVAVRVHGHDRREVLDRQVPHRFGRAELHQRDAVDLLDRARVELRRAADGVQIHGAVILHRGQRLRAHAAL